jgi:hypothetical protein
MSTRPQDLLEAAELKDGYRAACANSELNALAREGQIYYPSFLAEDDARQLLQEVDSISLLNDCTVITLHSSADNGYPHTRPNRIVCMPTSAVTGKTTNELSETLRHEAIHIHQRENLPLWTAACMRDGWQPCPPGQIPARLRSRCRINPDTLRPQTFWSWEGRHVPLPLFIRDDRPTLDGVQIAWYDLKMQGTYGSAPPSFQRRYGQNPPQPEHPFELLAVEAAAADVRDAASLEKWLGKLDGQRRP